MEILQIIIRIILSLLALTAPSQKVEAVPAHVHQYTQEVSRIEPTCAADGQIIYRCSCGDEIYESLPKTERHRWTSSVIVGPTVVNDGIKRTSCTVCGITYDTALPRVKTKIDVDSKTPCDLFGHLPEDEQKLVNNIFKTYSDELKKPEDERNSLLLIDAPANFDYDRLWRVRFAIQYAYGLDSVASDGLYFIDGPFDGKWYVHGAFVNGLDVAKDGSIVIERALFSNLLDEKLKNEEKCRQILSSFVDGTDIEIVEQIFKYSDTHFKYNAGISCVQDMFAHGAGSCNAKSEFIRMCCTMCGIPCDVVVGLCGQSLHAWNRIVLDGKSTFWDAIKPSVRNIKYSPYHPKCLNTREYKDVCRSMPDLVF